jgi:membrane protein YdbS with pleckstrin-like domain
MWRVIAPILMVPTDVPTMPRRGTIAAGAANEGVEAFKPADGFLRYMKFWFWLFLWPIDIILLGVWVLLGVWNLWIALAAAPLMIVFIVAPDLIAYVAIHLRYEATWYVMTDRAIRIRRGIWIIRETTISFENVQNVKVNQGPVQRHYGISDLIIETAGAGVVNAKSGTSIGNQGVIEGIADAPRIREVILRHLRESQLAGLGDEEGQSIRAAELQNSRATSGLRPAFSPAHVALLREIRDEVQALAGAL